MSNIEVEVAERTAGPPAVRGANKGEV
jgi:hypothetical protein